MTPALDYDFRDDSLGCFELWVAYRRERGVRAGRFTPRNDYEVRQALEGPRPRQEMDCIKKDDGK
jgi:hypothetical protein